MVPLFQISFFSLLSWLLVLVSYSRTVAFAPRIHGQILLESRALKDSYDYVIIGGGTAGLTVGDRLSGDGRYTVLVIENGELANSNEIDKVRDRITWIAEPWWLYNITSAPNKELVNLEFPVYVASLVGGSSAINGMQTIRGTRDDYNRWGSFFGSNSSWSWEGILPYFKKALHFQPPNQFSKDQMPGLRYDDSYWGSTSRIFAGWPSFQWPGIKYQFEAYLALEGVDVPEDSGAGKTGVYWYPTYMDAEGSVNRSYSRTGHWDRIHRSNYDLIINTKVTKILLDGNKATGVEFYLRDATDKGAERVTVKANKEVILSAGTIHSPQLLQLSGIGPRKLLKSANISTKVDLPGVGQNFHDHTTLTFEIKYQNYTTRPNRRDDFQSPAFIARADSLWAANRTGPWSRGLWNTGAWLPMPVIAPSTHQSIAARVAAQDAASFLPVDSHPTIIAGYRARLASLAAAIRSPDDVFYSHYFSGDEPVNYITYEHPLSLGTVNINASHPHAEPVVDYRTYSNPADLDIVLALARFHRRVNTQSPHLVPFAPLETKPGANVTVREDLLQYIRENTLPSAMHPVGTCAMMPLALGGVVDERLRVYGVDGLRVVDASVMSVIIGGNIAGAVYAIAEKAADMILERGIQ